MRDIDPQAIEAILDAAEKRVVDQVRLDIELMGQLDEAELKVRVKAAPAAIRGTLAVSLAGID